MDIDNELEENETDVGVEEFAEHLGLEILHSCKSGSMHMATLNINRPGLQLSGYYEHFGKDRVQVIGEMETAYLKQLKNAERLKALEKLFSFGFPCLVISSGLEPCEELLACAKKYDKTVFRSKQRSTMIINGLSIYLNELLAPRIVMHGVLLDLYGVGVLMTGKSSVGKSETAIELIQRGHRLVADDAVCIKRVSDRLVGSSPELIRYMMEVRNWHSRHTQAVRRGRGQAHEGNRHGRQSRNLGRGKGVRPPRRKHDDEGHSRHRHSELYHSRKVGSKSCGNSRGRRAQSPHKGHGLRHSKGARKTTEVDERQRHLAGGLIWLA